MLRASFPPAVSRAANGSWLSVSLKHTTFKHSPSVGGNDEQILDQLQYRKQFAGTVDGDPSIGILYHFPSCTNVPAMAMPLTALRLIIPTPTIGRLRSWSRWCLWPRSSQLCLQCCQLLLHLLDMCSLGKFQISAQTWWRCQLLRLWSGLDSNQLLLWWI